MHRSFLYQSPASQFTMGAFIKTLSHWANRHARFAILLIILGEVANGFNGVLLGASLLDNVSPAGLTVAMIGLIIGVAYIYQVASRRAVSENYWVIRRCLFLAFLGNFLLFGILGGMWSHRVQMSYSPTSVLGHSRSVAVRDTIRPTADSLQRIRQSEATAKKTADNRRVGRRLTYVLLGLVGVAVMLTVTGLACGILCSGYGFAALLVFYLGLGGLAGTVYFISRAGDNPLRRRDMTRLERKRDIRRFWLSWLLFIGIFSIIILAVSIR